MYFVMSHLIYLLFLKQVIVSLNVIDQNLIVTKLKDLSSMLIQTLTEAILHMLCTILSNVLIGSEIYFDC